MQLGCNLNVTKTSWANARVKLHSQVHIELGLQVLTRPVLTWPVWIWPDLMLYTYPWSYPSTQQLLPGKYRNTSLAVQGALARWGFLLFLFLFLLLWQGENKVNSYSDQLKLGQVCKFGVEFDKNKSLSNSSNASFNSIFRKWSRSITNLWNNKKKMC